MVFGEVKVSEEAIPIAASLTALYLNAAEESEEFEQLCELVLDVLGCASGNWEGA